jgi:hypothetical protein
MRNFRGTKGKWVIDVNDIQTVLTDNGAYRPNAIQITTSTKIELKANALLISKSPEMLEMLEELRGIFDKYSVDFQSQFFKYKEPLEQLIKEATEL